MPRGQLPENSPVRETVTGCIVPDAWDNKYRVTGVVIACNNERELEVVNLTAHPELSGLCMSRITATGIVMVRDGREQIQVENFRVLTTDASVNLQPYTPPAVS